MTLLALTPPTCFHHICVSIFLASLIFDASPHVILLRSFSCMKMCSKPEDDALLNAQCQRFMSLSLSDIGLERRLQPSSMYPFSSCIELLLVIIFPCDSLKDSFTFRSYFAAFAVTLMSFAFSGHYFFDLPSFETSAHSGVFPLHISRIRNRCKIFCDR